MAKYDEIRYDDLARFLERVGFVCRTHDKVHVWEHPQFDNATLTFPAYRPEDLVWSAAIGQVRGVFNAAGVMDHDDFDRWRLNLYVCDCETVKGQGSASRKGRKRTGKPDPASDRQHASATADAKKGRKRTGKPGPASS